MTDNYTVEALRDRLYGMAEENYKEFNQKLLPGVEHVIGIRLPALRKLAKETAKGDFRRYLDEAEKKIGQDSLHEEIMLQGLVLGYARMEREERKKISGRVCAEDPKLGSLRQLCHSI